MGQEPLNIAELCKLIKLFRKVVSFISNLEKKDRLASKIEAPKIPVVLSQSLILNLVRKNKLLKTFEKTSVRFGGRTADIIVKTKGKQIKVEVKATGKSAFVDLGVMFQGNWTHL